MIQFDEPAFNVYMDDVKRWGIDALHRAIEGLKCTTGVHICYGYGIQANLDWKKTLGDEWRQYEEIFPALAKSRIDQVSLECIHSHVPLELLKLLKGKDVLVGVIDVATDAVETPQEVAEAIGKALKYVPAKHLFPCTNCGMAPMDREVAVAKLRALGDGAALAQEARARDNPGHAQSDARHARHGGVPPCIGLGRRARRPARRRLGGRCRRRGRYLARGPLPAHVRHRRRRLLADLRRQGAQGFLPGRRRPRGRVGDARALRRAEPRSRSAAVPRRRSPRPARWRASARRTRGMAACRSRAACRTRSTTRARASRFPRARALDRADGAGDGCGVEGIFSPRGTPPAPSSATPPRRKPCAHRRAGARRLLRRRGGEDGRWRSSAASSPSATSPRKARAGASRSAALTAASPSTRRRRRRRASPCSRC